MNEMRVNDNEMSKRWNNEAWSIPEISLLRYPVEYIGEKNGKGDGF